MFNNIIIFHSYAAFLGDRTISLLHNYFAAQRALSHLFQLHSSTSAASSLVFMGSVDFLFPFDQVCYLLLKITYLYPEHTI